MMTEMSPTMRLAYNERYGKAMRYGVGHSVAREDAWADALRARREELDAEFDTINEYANVVDCEWCSENGYDPECPMCAGIGFLSGWTSLRVIGRDTWECSLVPCDTEQLEKIAEWREAFPSEDLLKGAT